MLTLLNKEFKSLIEKATALPLNNVHELLKNDGLGTMICKLPTLEMIWGKPQYEDFFGFSFEEVTHHPSFVVQQLHPDDLLRASMDIGSKMDGKPVQEIYRIRDKSGKYRSTLITSNTFKGKTDTQEEMFVLMRYCDLSALILSRNLYHTIMEEAEQIRANMMLSGLSFQEKEVLFHIGYAKQDKEIAEEMNLSVPSIV